MKNVAAGIAAAWALVALISAMIALDEYSPALCGVAVITLLGALVGVAFHLGSKP